MKTPLFLGGLLVASLSSVAFAHEAPCPYCAMPITQDTAQQDNEVALKYGRKRIEYKCVYCAVADSKTEYGSGDISILAPSDKKAQPIILKRTGGAWSAAPATAAFVLNQPLKHKTCDIQARAFTTAVAAKAYAQAKGFPAPLSLTELVEQAK
jgi:hypothetical protein